MRKVSTQKRYFLLTMLMFLIMLGGIIGNGTGKIDKVSAAETLLWPVPGHTTLSRGYIAGSHTAIDVWDSNINGQTVVSAISGTVVNIYLCGEQHYGSLGDCAGFGTGLIIQGTDGRYYLYAHMQANSIPSNVYYGAYISRGQELGKVGTTGNSTGPHLHFGIANNASNRWSGELDPMLETYEYSGVDVMPTSVTLNKSSVTLTSKGETVSLAATVSPSNATDTSVTWTSSNTSVATVDINGKVTAVGKGTATITATTNSGGKKATCNVIVAIQSFDGWYYTTSLPFEVTSTYYDIQYQNIYVKYATSSPGTGWSDTGVDKKEYTKSGGTYEKDFPIETSDTVQLVEYYYYHWCGPNTAWNDVNYYQRDGYVHYDSMHLDYFQVYEYASGTDLEDSSMIWYHLKWAGGDYDACCHRFSTGGTCDGSAGEHDYRSPYWYKKYVYQNYTVTNLNEYKKTSSWGTTKDSSATTVNIRFRLKPTGVSLNKTSATLTASGATVQLTPTVLPSDAGCKDVTWKSSNSSVATVDANGLVTAVGNGTATITVTTESGSKTATCTVTVSIATTGVSLNKTSATLTSKGATVQLTATVSPSDAADKNVTWKSSNTSVATVDATGKVTAVGNGTATITVTTASGSKTATCTVTVSIATTGVSLNKTSATLTSKGETVQLTATVSPSDAANKNVTWISSNTSVATVDANGLVTAVGNGTATITVTTVSGSKFATCNVTVYIDDTWSYDITDDGVKITGYNGDDTIVIIPETIAGVQVRHIGDNVFKNCDTITKIVIPNSVKTIGARSFYKCSGLTEIDLPDSLTSIGTYAFYECTGLTELVIPEGVTNVDANAFCACTNLKSVYIPKSLTTLENKVFRCCESLMRVYLPNAFTTMDAEAFDDCSGLKEVVILSDNVAIAGETANLFHGVADGFRVYCSNGSTTDTNLKALGVTCKALDYCSPLMLSKTTVALNSKDSCDIYLYRNPYRSDYKSVVWSSDKASVATVNQNGVITAVGDGKATITVTVTFTNGAVEKATVTVNVGSTGWKQVDGKWYYYDDNYNKVTGWKKVDGKWYYFDTAGARVHSWKSINKKWYFFDTNGIMKTGWLKDGGSWYYLNTDGEMQTSWKKVNNKWYYFGTDGRMCVSWKKINNKWYYFNSDGDMATSWKKVGAKWYYFNTDGDMQVSWKKLNNKWYYFNTDGDMHVGWKSIGGTWYYFNSDGDMHIGWKKLNGTWYYFDSEGAMVTGRYKINGTWNTFTSDGAWVG